MKPTEKAPQMDSFIEAVAGKNRRTTIESQKCMTCDSPNMQFRDALSRQEYAISGMCQNCQDSVFGVEGDDADDS